MFILRLGLKTCPPGQFLCIISVLMAVSSVVCEMSSSKRQMLRTNGESGDVVFPTSVVKDCLPEFLGDKQQPFPIRKGSYVLF